MYVDRASWSEPDPGDPSPCFRQGDVVRVSLLRPDVAVTQGGRGIKVNALETRVTDVVLVSACCDLVIRKPPKRLSALAAPLRELPDQFVKRPEDLAILRALTSEGKSGPTFANLFYLEGFDEANGQAVPGGTIHLETCFPLGWDFLKHAVKLAELSDPYRRELQERIKFHFTREPAPAPGDPTK
jgi:hypothetical protein